MQRKYAFLAAAALAGSLLTACGGSDESGRMAGNQLPESLDTQQVLVLARATPDNTLPFEVNDGALVLYDTSESSQPLSINAM